MADKAQSELLNEVRERFKQCVEAESEQRSLALGDLKFLDGDQWPQHSLNERKADNRPALVVNRMDQFVQQITNNLRQNKISARVFPVDQKADPETAKAIQGHLRHIENNSDADLAYNTGAFYAVAMGWGYWHVLTRYCDPLSFDLDIVIDRVKNPFQVYLDPNHQHPTGKDAKFGFLAESLSRDEFKKLYPNAKDVDHEDFSGIGDNDWITEENVRVVLYYKIDEKKETLVKLVDGTAALKSKVEDESLIARDASGKMVERETALGTVRAYKTNGLEILEETVWPTAPDYVSIPLVKVIGNELDVDGKQKLKGIIRNLKDAQMQYNFMLTAQTESIDSSKGQVVAVEGMLEGHEAEWAEPSRHKILQVTGVQIGGQPAPLPTRLQPNMSIQAMTEARLMAADDLKALTGIYDAALGAKSNETSGRAITSRQAQSDNANYHFTGNLVRSVNHSGRLILGAMPTIYDTERSARIIGDDDSQEVVTMVGKNILPERKQQLEMQKQIDPKLKYFDLSTGKYDVVFNAGPNALTQQEADREVVTNLLQAAPFIVQMAPDKVLKAIGAPQDLVDAVAAAAGKGKDESIPPAAQAQMQQMQQTIEQLGQALQEAQNPITIKQMELEHKERSEAANRDYELRKLQLQLDSSESIALLKAEIDAIKAGQQLNAKQAAAEAGAGAQEM